ncbi:MAG: APC family permease, partial [bacterium]|nr:APC family permease [bacterium]
MAELHSQKRLKKELGLLDVYAVATGATLSAGFFLLPGLAAVQAGPGIVLAYMIAAVPLIPAMFSIVELATAMPRAGGVYYFLDRTMGPLAGTIGGMGTWLALVLKVSFALVGMGAYLALFFDSLPIKPIAIGLAVVLGIVNLFGARKSGGFQIFLVCALLVILAGFIGVGIPRINMTYFQGMLAPGWSGLLSTAGLVYISYVGVTKVASLSEEVKNPERNLPLGVFLAMGTAILVYGLGMMVIVGLIPPEQLAGDLTPVATAAENALGPVGKVLVSVAALLAFISVANAGTLSASRYPLAMSRDHMLPRFFQRLGKQGTPYFSILTSMGAIVLILLLLDPTGIAKLASAFQLLMFALVCLAVIVMRESRIAAYDPGYHSPFYPWMQLFGMVASVLLIVEMGWLPALFSTGLIVLGTGWYWYYARGKVVRDGAIYHIFERLGQRRYEGLDRELRGILKEKGLREDDPFEEVVARSLVIDLVAPAEFQDVAHQAAQWLSTHVPHTTEEIEKELMDGTQVGATPVTHGVALP